MFAIQTQNMEILRSFSACKVHFDRTEKSARACWQENERPLQHVRKHHMRLRKIDDDTYACTLYNTDMVTYRRRGPITISLNNSASSRKFLDRTLPPGVMCGSFNGSTVLLLPTAEEVLYLAGNKIVIEKKEGEHRGGSLPTYRLVSGAHQRVREQLDKDMAKELRAKFKPFLTWWKAANNVVPFGKTCGYKLRFDELIKQIDDRDNWGVLAQLVGTPTDFMAQIYDAAGVRKLLPIPNTEPFKRGRLAQST